MMNYNGDTEEDVEANSVVSKLMGDDDLEGVQKFIAADYFAWGWEAAMDFVKKKGQS
jgi:hypothetical protein